MKLNGFGAALIATAGERLAEAQADIDAGWTPDDHPAICCPTDEPLPKTVRTPEKRRAWCYLRAGNAERMVKRLRRLTTKLQSELEPDSRDTATINIPIHKRAASIDSDITKAAQLVKARAAIKNHQTRADHWRKKAESIK